MIHPAYDFFYTEQENLKDLRLIDSSKPIQEDSIAWKAIDSLISNQETEQVEAELKVRLPDSYKYYLQYKNFYELAHLTDVWMFCPLIPQVWQTKIKQAAFNQYRRGYLYEKGLVPFADCSDWGAVCFNTNVKQDDGEYEIVIWDHERPRE